MARGVKGQIRNAVSGNSQRLLEGSQSTADAHVRFTRLLSRSDEPVAETQYQHELHL